jgi:hypothetical protein
MRRIRPYIDEMTRALLVLALIFLNLAHPPAPVVAYDGFAFTSTGFIFCGDDAPGDQSTHAPCHACRIGGDPVLPPAPCDATHIPLEAVPVSYSPAETVPQGDLNSVANRSRGPPLRA